MAVSVQVTFDCADPDREAAFWAEVLGYVVQPPPEGYADWESFLREQNVPDEEWNNASAIVDPERNGPRIYFQKVPEAKAGKNRVHLDVNVGTGLTGDERRAHIAGEVQRVIALGARRVRAYDEHGEYWVVMQDPEGNEFCLQ
jgi:catechol 2,3-dioxygenase-like lactoylglutathione lyase family enzyme